MILRITNSFDATVPCGNIVTVRQYYYLHFMNDETGNTISLIYGNITIFMLSMRKLGHKTGPEHTDTSQIGSLVEMLQKL